MPLNGTEWCLFNLCSPRHMRPTDVVRQLTTHLRLAFFALIAIVLVRVFILDPMVVKYGSMYPTLQQGDWILVEKVRHGPTFWRHPELRLPRMRQVQMSDVITFSSLGVAVPGSDDGEILVKRIVGLPGDTIWMQNQLLYRNSVPDTTLPIAATSVSADEGGSSMWWMRAHVIDGASLGIDITRQSPGTWGPIIVPNDSVFVLGDDLSRSVDSRRFGPVSESAIHGVVRAIYWPSRSSGSDQVIHRAGRLQNAAVLHQLP